MLDNLLTAEEKTWGNIDMALQKDLRITYIDPLINEKRPQKIKAIRALLLRIKKNQIFLFSWMHNGKENSNNLTLTGVI